MIKKHTVAELCEHELNGIDAKTFRRNKKNYLQNLEKSYFVEIIGQRNQIFVLTPKEQSKQQKDDAEFLEILGCDIGRKNIELMKFILKTLLEKQIVPAQDEITHWARQENLVQGEKHGTVGNYMGFLREHNILIDPMETPVWVHNPDVLPEYDKETGEIFPTYIKKHVTFVYYDYAENGVGAHRKRLGEDAQKAIHQAYQIMYAEEFQRVIVPLLKKKVDKSTISEQIFFLKMRVLQTVGEAYGLNKCVRLEEPIINFEVASKLKNYFGLNKPKSNDVEINVDHIEVININRPVCQLLTNELEALMDYNNLLNKRIEIYKSGKDAFPLYMYEKWHGDKFEERLKTSKVLDQNNSIPAFDLSESFKDYKKSNVVALSTVDIAETVDKDLLKEELDFEKQLMAFKFKPKEDITVIDGKNLMLKAMMMKRRELTT
ncbi:hypothetical protein LIT25_23945 [Bacillus sp. F19]|nr:hypothetical protein LIT25_23945 [Bacillus sp. F19]